MRVHSVQHAPFESLGSIEPWLADHRIEHTTTRLYNDERLPDLAGIDWVISMGGPMSVNDELPWMEEEKRFLREAVRTDKTVFGICLGAQLLASSLGAPVAKAEEREIGWFEVERTDRLQIPDAEGQQAAGEPLLPLRFRCFHWHGETFALPPGARLLARSDGCAHQAFSLGPRVLGFQFHLEITPEDVSSLVRHCADDLAPGPFVQQPAQMPASTDDFLAANRVMAHVLELLRRATAESESARAGRPPDPRRSPPPRPHPRRSDAAGCARDPG